MATSDVFVIPAGLKLELGADGLIIENDGDIEVRSPLGQRVMILRSAQGNVSIHADVQVAAVEAPLGTVTFVTPAKVGRVEANHVLARAGLRAERLIASGGEVHLAGAVDVARINARIVRFEGGVLRGKVIEADEVIQIIHGHVTADILIAPAVHLDLGVTGKITVVESHNDLGSIAVRGCLRLSELDDLGGNSKHFLAERNLEPLAGPAEAPADAPAQAPSEPAKQPTAQAAAVERSPIIVEVTEEPTPAQASPRPEYGEIRPLGDEQLDTFVEEDDSPPIPEVDPVHKAVLDALQPILNAYGESELPPPIAELQGWLVRKDYDLAREGIANTFLQLNKHHNRQKTPLKPNVTAYFTALNAVVRRLKR